jgi:hypothetical protein
MKRFQLSRRAMLRGAGGVAIGLPFLEAMRPFGGGGKAHAAGSTPPKRFIVFFSPDGSIRENWTPTGTETNFTLSPILTPLAANKQSIVVLDGVENKVGGYGAVPGDDHMKGMGAMLTGRGLLPGSTQGGAGDPAGLASGISVDQAIATAIGGGTKFRSLELGVQSGSAGTVWGYTAYSGSNQPLPPDNNPASVWNRVFSAFGADPAILRQAAERKSVLDAVMQSYGKLNPKLGTADKAKLDEHLGNLRDLETRLTATGTTGGSCMKPASPGTIDYKTNDNFPMVGKLQMDLLVMAMACDLTRVGTIQWEQSVGNVRFTWVDPTITRGHHDMSHDGDDVTATMAQLTKINTWYASQLNYLIESLKSAKEADGSSMLDNTLIVWVNELSRGNAHSHDHMPFVLAGGAGGALRAGRFLSYPKSVSHNNMLVSCMNLMGLPDTTFGDPAFCTGPLANL